MTGDFSTKTGKTLLLTVISDKETVGTDPANLNSSSLLYSHSPDGTLRNCGVESSGVPRLIKTRDLKLDKIVSIQK